MTASLFKTANYVYNQFLNPLTKDGLPMQSLTKESYENLQHNSLGVADGIPRDQIVKRRTFIKDYDTLLFGVKVILL